MTKESGFKEGGPRSGLTNLELRAGKLGGSFRIESATAPAERSCCCIAKPAVVALMPAAPGQQTQADLLL